MTFFISRESKSLTPKWSYTREYKITINCQDAPEKTDNQLVFSLFPDDDSCLHKFKLRLEKATYNSWNNTEDRTKVEMFYWNSQCSSSDKKHYLEISIDAINQERCFKSSYTHALKCNRWNDITNLHCPFSHSIILEVKIKIPILKKMLSFKALEEEEELRDFTLEDNGGEKYRIHRVVFATHSSVFKNMQNDIKDCANMRLDGDEVVVKEFVRYLYQVRRPRSKFWELLLLARDYSMDDLEDQCVAGLIESLSVNNALEMVNEAVRYKCASLLFASAYFFKKNWYKILSSADDEVSSLCSL